MKAPRFAVVPATSVGTRDPHRENLMWDITSNDTKGS